MTMEKDAKQKIEAYLSGLREQLRGLSPDDVSEIVEELRSHILDKAAADGQVTAAGAQAALAALGDPEQLAREYLTDDTLARAVETGSPLRVLRLLFLWASFSAGGFVALLVALAGYFVGIAFVLCAVLKPFHPQAAGLWIVEQGGDLTYSLRLGFGNVPADGREILGWWIVPMGLALGCSLVILTSRAAVWIAQRFRPPSLRPERIRV